jgi:hypothetical protein
MLSPARAYPGQWRADNQVPVSLLIGIRSHSGRRPKKVLEMANDDLSGEPIPRQPILLRLVSRLSHGVGVVVVVVKLESLRDLYACSILLRPWRRKS